MPKTRTGKKQRGSATRDETTEARGSDRLSDIHLIGGLPAWIEDKGSNTAKKWRQKSKFVQRRVHNICPGVYRHRYNDKAEDASGRESNNKSTLDIPTNLLDLTAEECQEKILDEHLDEQLRRLVIEVICISTEGGTSSDDRSTATVSSLGSKGPSEEGSALEVDDLWPWFWSSGSTID